MGIPVFDLRICLSRIKICCLASFLGRYRHATKFGLGNISRSVMFQPPGNFLQDSWCVPCSTFSLSFPPSHCGTINMMVKLWPCWSREQMEPWWGKEGHVLRGWPGCWRKDVWSPDFVWTGKWRPLCGLSCETPPSQLLHLHTGFVPSSLTSSHRCPRAHPTASMWGCPCVISPWKALQGSCCHFLSAFCDT